MFKLGKENIDKVYLGKSPIQKMYLGKTLIFPNEEAAECYAITPSIAQYDGDYPWVWAEDVQKWYRLNSYNEYEEYGILVDSIEPDIIETTDYYNCAFNGGSNYEVVSSQTSGVNYYMKVEFTTPESITDQSFLFGTRGTLFGSSFYNAFAAGLYPEGDTGMVLKAQLGSGTTVVGELQPSTKYVGEFQIVMPSTTARIATYTIYDEVGEVVYSGRNNNVSFSGLKLNMMIGALRSSSTLSATTSLPYSGEMSRFTIKKSSIDIPDNYNWEDVCDVVFTDENGTIVPVNLYSTDVTIASGAGNTATLTDKAGEFKTIIERGESRYKGKLSIVDGIEYEWNGSKWVNIGVSYVLPPIVESTTFTQSGTYQGYSAYTPSDAATREFRATFSGKGTANVYCQIYTYSGTYTANTYLDVYVNDVLQHTFKNTVTGKTTKDYSFTIEYNEGDTIRLRGRKYSTSNCSMKFSLSDLFHVDKQYEPREAPEKILYFDSIEEMEAYECAYEGAVAMVGDVTYVYINDNWTLPDYSKAIKYTTTDGKPLSITVAGSTANVMINGVGYYLFDDVPTSVADNTFSGQTTLKTIDLPEGVTSIGGSAFATCTSLTSITVPDSVTSIGGSTFSGCTSLASVTIPDSVTTIGTNAFLKCSSLTSITIPDSVTRIEIGTFSSCSGLTSIVIPDSVTFIGDSAFNGCSKLTGITIPDSITSIRGNTFNGCSKLASVTIPDSVTSIGGSAFGGCSSLTSVTIPNSVTSIGSSAFQSCSGLTSIVIPDSVTTIGNSAFTACVNITSATIGSGLKTLSNNMFSSCSKLASINIPDTITSIGQQTFINCTALATVTIGSGMTSIGGGAFSECKALSAITITAPTRPELGTGVFLHPKEYGTLTYPEGSNYNYWLGNSVGFLGYYNWNAPEAECYPASCDKYTGKELGTMLTYDVPKGETTITDCNYNLTGLKTWTARPGDYTAFQGTQPAFNVSLVTDSYSKETYDTLELVDITLPDSLTAFTAAFGTGVGKLKKLKSITFRNFGVVKSISGKGGDCFNIPCLEYLKVDTYDTTTFTSSNGLVPASATALTDFYVDRITPSGTRSFTAPNLTHDSLLRIINALEQPETGAQTCTLGATNLAKLTEEEIAIATSNRWIVQ